MTLIEILHKPHRRRRPPPLRNENACICWQMDAAIAAAFAVPVDELRALSRRTAGVAFARQCAMYLAHVVLCLNYRATGRLFRRDRTTAAHACQLVEARRDDPAIDRLLQMLEEVCDELVRNIRRQSQVRR
jgi:chromosomal replication initiation ATPase DnaA